VILDATFLRDDSRRQCRELAERAGVGLLFVFADCPERTVAQRLRRRATAYSLSDANLDVYRSMKARFIPPRPGRDVVRVDTRQPVKRSLGKIERALLRR
jgi:predicted kinase